jgi:hypothetical protein
MAPPSWTTEVQLEFLSARKVGFLQAQTNANQSRFFATLFEEWFQQWPVRERLFPTPEGGFAPVLTPIQLAEVQKAVTGQQEVCTKWSVGHSLAHDVLLQRLKSWFRWHTRKYES